jgi:hypothetical protein
MNTHLLIHLHKINSKYTIRIITFDKKSEYLNEFFTIYPKVSQENLFCIYDQGKWVERLKIDLEFKKFKDIILEKINNQTDLLKVKFKKPIENENENNGQIQEWYKSSFLNFINTKINSYNEDEENDESDDFLSNNNIEHNLLKMIDNNKINYNDYIDNDLDEKIKNIDSYAKTLIEYTINGCVYNHNDFGKKINTFKFKNIEQIDDDFYYLSENELFSLLIAYVRNSTVYEYCNFIIKEPTNLKIKGKYKNKLAINQKYINREDIPYLLEYLNIINIDFNEIIEKYSSFPLTINNQKESEKESEKESKKESKKENEKPEEVYLRKNLKNYLIKNKSENENEKVIDEWFKKTDGMLKAEPEEVYQENKIKNLNQSCDINGSDCFQDGIHYSFIDNDSSDNTGYASYINNTNTTNTTNKNINTINNNIDTINNNIDNSKINYLYKNTLSNQHFIIHYPIKYFTEIKLIYEINNENNINNDTEILNILLNSLSLFDKLNIKKINDIKHQIDTFLEMLNLIIENENENENENNELLDKKETTSINCKNLIQTNYTKQYVNEFKDDNQETIASNVINKIEKYLSHFIRETDINSNQIGKDLVSLNVKKNRKSAGYFYGIKNPNCEEITKLMNNNKKLLSINYKLC